MRKLLFVLLGTLISLCSYSQEKRQAIDSKIEKVTVFLEGAQVNRSAKSLVPAGKTELVFSNISPLIDKQSIQVKAEGKVTILSVIHQLNYLKEQEVREEIRNLDLQKQSLQEKITNEKNMTMVYRQEEALLLKNQDIKGVQANLRPTDLKEAADFQRARLTEVYNRLTEIDRSIQKMQTETDKINQQLKALNEKRDQSTSELIVTLTAKEATTASFQVSYLVKKASWYPTYDIRVADISSPLNLQCKANITQQSGEDWKEVKLQLSTGNPNEDGSRPNLFPWYLNFNSFTNSYKPPSGNISPNTVYGRVLDRKGSPVAGASVVIKGTKTGTLTNAEGFFSIQTPENSSTLVISGIGYQTFETYAQRGYMNINLAENTTALSEVVVVGLSTVKSDDIYEDKSSTIKKRKEPNSISTTTIYQPTTTVYEIKEAYTVLNDGKVYTADIASYEINADYEYFSIPKVSPDAYLTARITDWQELNLLPGEANLFFEGTFLGKSLLDVTAAGDTLNLSLGKDKGVVVKRTLLKEYSQKKFLGSNRTDSRQYEISVRNNKSQPIHITLEDQFPISTNKEIEVDNKEAKDARMDDTTQKITWQLTVEQKKEEKKVMGYTVKYPKEKRVVLE